MFAKSMYMDGSSFFFSSQTKKHDKSSSIKFSPLLIFHQSLLSLVWFLCHPRSVFAPVCRSQGSPRSAHREETLSHKSIDYDRDRAASLSGNLSGKQNSLLTLVFLSSAVVSSNASLSLNLASVVLKVLWDFMHITPWSLTLKMKLGLVLFPTCRVGKLTPEGWKNKSVSFLPCSNSYGIKLYRSFSLG